jgi:pentatricopeptide repeat protein
MELLLKSTMSAVAELVSVMWLELAMLIVAAVGYVLLNGDSLVPRKKAKYDEPQPEPEKIAQELQSKLASGDLLAAYKLWQRAKSVEQALSGGALFAAADAMRRLGRSTAEIAMEFSSALECNPALGEAEAAAELLDVLEKEGQDSSELRSALSAAFSEAKAPSRARQSLRRQSLETVLGQLERLARGKDAEVPKDMVVQALNLAAREHRLGELVDRLSGLRGVALVDTSMINTLLTEAARRRDTVLCRQAYRLAGQLDVVKDVRTFELLARGLAADAVAVRALFEEVELSEVASMTEPLCLAFLAACSVCQDMSLAERVFEARRRDSGGAVDEACCAALLKSYSDCGLHDRVCQVYEREMAPRKMALSKQLGERVVKSAAQAGRSELAQDLCTSSAAEDASRHVAMVRACGRDGNLEGSVAAFRRLQQSGSAVGTREQNALLQACVQCRDSEQALELFAAMKKDGAADVVSFNIVMKLLLSLGQLEEAREILQEMSACGLEANVVSYNALLHAKVSKGDARGAWAIVAEMQAANVQPNSITCSILLKSLTRSSLTDDCDRVMALVDSMQEKMDEVLFSSVVEACIRIGRLDAVAVQMRKFASQGGLVALTSQTYGSLFKAYGQAGDMEKLWELWNEMEQREVMPTSVTVGCFVDALASNGCAEEALSLVHRLLLDPKRASLVNNIIFSTLLKGFGLTKQVDRLFTVYAEMRGAGIPCNSVTYNTMMDACARCGCMDRAFALLADMRAAGISPDKITYSTLVKGHCFSGDIDAAFSALKEMRDTDGLVPDEIIYNSLLDGCAKEHRLQEALDLFATMRAEGVRPSNFTLCTLVKLLGRARRLPQAFGILDELCGAGGLRPNVQVYTCLMTACMDNGQLEKALQLQNQVITGGCRPDAKMYNALVRGCLRAGSMTKAVEVVRCAYQLSGHGFTAPECAVGVDTRVLEELVVRLNQGGRADGEAARSLVADLKQWSGVTLQDSIYAQVAQRVARGAR